MVGAPFSVTTSEGTKPKGHNGATMPTWNTDPVTTSEHYPPRLRCAAMGEVALKYRLMPESPAVDTVAVVAALPATLPADAQLGRSEEHTSELQSRRNFVCRLLLEKNNLC